MNNKTALISSNDLYIHGLWWQSHTWSSAKQWCTLMRGAGQQRRSQTFNISNNNKKNHSSLWAQMSWTQEERCTHAGSMQGCEGVVKEEPVDVKMKKREEERGLSKTGQMSHADYNWWQKEKKIQCALCCSWLQCPAQLILRWTDIRKKKAINKSFPITAWLICGFPLFFTTGLPQGAAVTLTAKLHWASASCCYLPARSKLIMLLNSILFAVIWFTEGSVEGLFHYGPILPCDWIHFTLYSPFICFLKRKEKKCMINKYQICASIVMQV